MKKLRVTIEGKTYDVLVEILDEGASTGQFTPGPAAAPAVSSPPPSPTAAPASTLAATPPPPAEAPATKSEGAQSRSADAVVSPLAGKVVSIDVKVGQTVDEGTQVATLEAMKMNTYIYAPKSGKVAAVLVNAGDAVEEGSALLRLD